MEKVREYIVKIIVETLFDHGNILGYVDMRQVQLENQVLATIQCGVVANVEPTKDVLPIVGSCNVVICAEQVHERGFSKPTRAQEHITVLETFIQKLDILCFINEKNPGLR